MHDLILASGSSRRHSLMDQLNLEYRAYVSNIDESVVAGELAEEYVCRMAREKALAVTKSITLENSQQKSKASVQPVIAADTIIAFNKEIVGKPKNVQDARNINNNDDYQSLVRTKVKFRLLTAKEIEAYCLTDEPYDKAGAYAIQGAAAAFVEYISGSYTNVVGLPLFAVCKLLNQAKLYAGNNLGDKLEMKRYNG